MKKIIEVNLQDKESYLSVFHKNRISKELSDYILDECKATHPRSELEIHISTDFEFSKGEQRELVDMIRENYGIDIREAYIFIERSRIKNLLCLLVGILFLFINLLVHIIPIVSEIFLIFGWVLIWEGSYNFLFGEFENKVQIKRLKKLTNCKVHFTQNKK
jgi:hypothetical protein